MHYRQLATDLGWPPAGASPVYLDNKTAINLVVAPEVTRKSRHIAVKHHYIRQLSARDIIKCIYVPSGDMRADVMTKYLARIHFIRRRDILLNRQALP